MTLKPCPACKKMLTTKTVYKIGRDASLGADLLYLNCKTCKTTIVLRRKSEKVEEIAA